jgi:hypothetical protein
VNGSLEDEWNDHISRMASTRVVKIARDKARETLEGRRKTAPILENWLGTG